MCVHVCVPVWAGVELTMPSSEEVYLGDSAQISCKYSFTEAAVEPSFLMIQWFVVSDPPPLPPPDPPPTDPPFPGVCCVSSLRGPSAVAALEYGSSTVIAASRWWTRTQTTQSASR